MDPLKVAARFVAFTCFLNADADGPASPQEAGKYARQNWSAYVNYTSEELGKLLTEKSAQATSAAATPRRRRPRATKSSARKLAVAS